MLNERETASLREQAMPRLLEEWRKRYEKNEPTDKTDDPGWALYKALERRRR